MNKATERPLKDAKITTTTYPGTVYTSRAKHNEGIWWRREWWVRFEVKKIRFKCPISRLEGFVDESKLGDDFKESEAGNFSHNVKLTLGEIIPLLKLIASNYYENSKEAKELLSELLPVRK